MSSNGVEHVSFGDRLLDLVAQSVIVQALVTLSLVGAVIYCTVAGRPVPDSLQSAMMLALGFYFGSKSQQIITNAARRLE
jgi:biotin transporter BioY